MAVRKGDRVLVIAGNDKGKVGEVLSRREERVVVQEVNVRKKHLRPTQQAQGGRVIQMEMPIHISNVCLCDKEGKRVKAERRAQSAERETEKKKKRSGTGKGTGKGKGEE